MEPSCVRQNLIPGTSKLFSDFLYNFDRVARFYPASPFDFEAIRSVAAALNYPESRRHALVSALREQNADEEALRRLSDPGTVAVITGQQVGLFSGPAYTIFKALTAVRLAEELSAQGIPAVPIFWLATEDHDLAEVDHAWVFNQDGMPTKIAVTNTVVNGGPVGDVQFNEMPLRELRAALGDLPFADEVMKRVVRAYRPGVTFGAAFKALLQETLGSCGLLYVDPLAPSIRDIVSGLLCEAVQRLPELLAALRERNHELTAAGYHEQVHLEEDSSLLFLLSEGKRTPLRWNGTTLNARDRVFTPSELAQSPARLSPNALLRPVMEDYLLPTAVYVGGPAEVAYMAQSQVLYQKLLGRMPIIFPRNSFTLLGERGSKLMRRYDLRLPDVLDYEEKVKSRIASRLVPQGLVDQFTAVRASSAASLETLKASLHSFDPTLEAAARKSAAKVLYQLERLANKTAREALRRDQRATSEANFLVNIVYPHRHLQERIYSIVPFLAKHGLDLPQKLLGMTQLTCPDHMVRTI
jgi:bacillithiol biosynthesis cysteine-adding enzyme BshC